MRNYLPLAILVLVALLFAAMPWRRSDPRHDFMLEMCKRLAEGGPACVRAGEFAASKEVRQSGHWTAVSDHHGTGSSHV